MAKTPQAKASSDNEKAKTKNGAADGSDNSDFESLPDEESGINKNGRGNSGERDENGGSESSETRPLNEIAKKRGKNRGKEDEPPTNGKKARKPAKKASRKDKRSTENDSNGDNGEEEEDLPEFEVEDIMAHKKENGVTMYRIRWKGYGPNDDTWEAEDALSCPDIIAKYKKKQKSEIKGKKPSSANNKKGKEAGTSKIKSKGKGNKKEAFKFDPEEEFVVEKIVNYSVEKNQRLFLIRWRGYPSSQDTWEPESNLSCDKLIEKFMEKIQDNENANFKELRTDLKKPKRLLDETVPRSGIRGKVERISKRTAKKRVYYGDSE